MRKLLFATGNTRKIKEARAACIAFGIDIEQIELDIDEIQHHHPIKITEHKADQAYNLVQKPVVINDASWNIPVLNGFPGGYMKDVAQWFTAEDFINIMKDKTDRRICCIETVIYKDGVQTKTFHKEFWGEIAHRPRGSGNSIEQVAIFNGKTIGEHRDNDQFAFDPKDYIWHGFAEWFSKELLSQHEN
jgi:XTP/dITP diphosphohydrolase